MKFFCLYGCLVYHILSYSLGSIFIILYMVVYFECFCLILYIIYSYCQVYTFLFLCMFCSMYSVSLCCSMYCLCVNVYCTAATGCQPNCSYKTYQYHGWMDGWINIQIDSYIKRQRDGWKEREIDRFIRHTDGQIIRKLLPT